MLILKKNKQKNMLNSLNKRRDKLELIKKKSYNKVDSLLGISLMLTACLFLVLVLIFGGLVGLISPLLFTLFYLNLDIIKKNQKANVLSKKVSDKITKINKNYLHLTDDLDTYYNELLLLKNEGRLNEISHFLLDDILDEMRDTIKTRVITKDDKINIFLEKEIEHKVEILIQND